MKLSLSTLAIITSFFANDCITYDYKNSQKELYSSLIYKDNWEYFSDDGNNNILLESKLQAKLCKIEPIPVLEFDRNEYLNSHNLKKSYKSYNGFFIGFLIKKNHPLLILQSVIDTKHEIGATNINVNILYEISKDTQKCLYFDNTFKTMAYLENNELYLWNYSEGKFINAVTCINHYGWKNIFKE